MYCCFKRVARLSGRASAKSDIDLACALFQPYLVSAHLGGQNDISVSDSYEATIQQLTIQDVEHRGEAICASEEDQYRVSSKFQWRPGWRRSLTIPFFS